MRYHRQELVIGKEAQQKIENATVAVVGLGALGTVSAELLLRAGIKKLIILDRDRVELTNLQRQLLYTESDVGKLKAEAAHDHLKGINATTEISASVTDLNHKNIDKILKGADIILDCTDNLYTRFLINEYAKKNNRSWIYAGAIKDVGNVMAVTPDTPCFRCLFEEAHDLETCDTAGVLATNSTIIAALQTQQAINIITGKCKEQLLIHFNTTTLQLTKVKTKHNDECPVCDKTYAYLEGKREEQLTAYQCDGLYQFYRENLDLKKTTEKLKALGKVTYTHQYAFFENISLFDNGRIFIKAKNENEAKATLSKYIGM